MWGKKYLLLKTIDDIEEYFSKTKHNDVKYPFALGKENIYYMLHQKYNSIEEFENDEMEDEYQYLYKKDSELKSDGDGEVEYGNDFLICEIINSKQ